MPSKQFSRKLPLWYQACESIRADIFEKIAANDLRLPTESQLAEDHDVSVITIRQALSVLEAEGLITRTRRRGTEINPSAVRSHAKELKVLGTLATVLNQNRESEPELLEKRVVATPDNLKTKFANAPSLTYMRRVRYAGNVPVNYCVNYIVPEFGEKIKKADMGRWPIPKILRDELGVKILRIDYVANAIEATAELAGYLKVKAKSPLLYLTATVFDTNEKVIDFGEIYCPAGKFSFDISIDMS